MPVNFNVAEEEGVGVPSVPSFLLVGVLVHEQARTALGHGVRGLQSYKMKYLTEEEAVACRLRIWRKGIRKVGSKSKAKIKDTYLGVLIGVVSDAEYGTDLVVVAPDGDVTHISQTNARVEYPSWELPDKETSGW